MGPIVGLRTTGNRVYRDPMVQEGESHDTVPNHQAAHNLVELFVYGVRPHGTVHVSDLLQLLQVDLLRSISDTSITFLSTFKPSGAFQPRTQAFDLLPFWWP